MRAVITLIAYLFFTHIIIGQELNIDFPYIKEVDYQGDFQQDYARYGVCQFRVEVTDTTQGLKTILKVTETKKKIRY